MDKRPIGVFDSGVGGLVTVQALRRFLPNETILYLGDTACEPYGNHSKELITRCAMKGLRFLAAKDAKLLVSSCGTISTVLPEAQLKTLPVPFLSMLLPCAQEACAASVHGVIGLIGTAATVRSLAFGRAIRSIQPDARVIGKACPLFTPLVDSGITQAQNHLLRLAIKQYLEPFINEGIDTLVLGSPQYSLLFGAISDVFDYGITLIDCAQVTARYVQSYLLREQLQNDGAGEAPTWMVTDAPDYFAQAAKPFYGEELREPVHLVTL